MLLHLARNALSVGWRSVNAIVFHPKFILWSWSAHFSSIRKHLT
jgi:hypothetical protein